MVSTWTEPEMGDQRELVWAGSPGLLDYMQAAVSPSLSVWRDKRTNRDIGYDRNTAQTKHNNSTMGNVDQEGQGLFKPGPTGEHSWEQTRAGQTTRRRWLTWGEGCVKEKTSE